MIRVRPSWESQLFGAASRAGSGGKVPFAHQRQPHPEIEARVSRVHPDSGVRVSRADSRVSHRVIISIRRFDIFTPTTCTLTIPPAPEPEGNDGYEPGTLTPYKLIGIDTASANVDSFRRPRLNCEGDNMNTDTERQRRDPNLTVAITSPSR
jgi:hypothetical protein